MAMPRPLRTFGTSVAGTDLRWPGRDTRRRPEIAHPVRPSYRRVTVSVPWWLSVSPVTTPSTKPSSRRISAMRTLRFERGHSTRCLRARMPLRIRARKSAMGSVIDMDSPARLDHARDLAAEREVTEAEAAHLELAQEGTGATAPLATVLLTDLELGLLGKPIDELAHHAAPCAGAA